MFMGGFEMMFSLVFVVVAGVIIFIVVKSVSEWHQNNNSWQLTVEAVVVSKRTDTTHHQQANGGDISGAHGYTMISDTTYYVTFQAGESRDRMEFHVTGREYGLLAEGDHGKLTFQGTRYLGFERAG
ncbi:DUF2500 domain-containing protein [Ruminococcus sp. OA3]|uniref:DUF2500 domain-containing protein n=1 Tax=Ruminococcus sp. OA3 TaxID=2914164 RepID=UPI001F052F06|nr:DUF2500 domain-containing protein [Ruminococcus sp. OA3]MCH1983355.1 DUF2500 domain-containing protein [Ruminococcus sp. OA3]